MKKTVAILSGIILVSFFLPWLRVDMESTIGVFGRGYSLEPVSAYLDMSLDALASHEAFRGFLWFLWIIPLFALAGLLYALLDRKNGYTWLGLYTSTTALIICSALVIAAQNDPGSMVSGDGFVSTAGSLRIGCFFAFMASIALWFVSLGNNARHYRSYKKVTICHIFIPVALIVISVIGYVGALKSEDIYHEGVSLSGMVLLPYITLLSLVIFVSSLITLVLALTVYRSKGKEYVAGTADAESAGEVPAEGQAKRSRGIGKNGLKYILWTAGAIPVIIVVWLIGAKITAKVKYKGSIERAFVERYHQQPDSTIRLSEDKILFIAGSGDGVRTKKFYVLHDTKPEYVTLLSLDKEHNISSDPLNIVSLVNIGNVEYLYMEYNRGPGNKDDLYIDHCLYGISTEEVYIVTYVYCPPGSTEVSSVISGMDPVADRVMSDFLSGKIRESELYRSDDFLVFIDKFCSDGDFQLSRIKFPVGHWKEIVTDERQIYFSIDVEYDHEVGAYVKKIPIRRSNWELLGKDSLTPFYDPANHFFAKWHKDSETRIYFLTGWVDSEYSNILQFEKIAGEWFLAGYF